MSVVERDEANRLVGFPRVLDEVEEALVVRDAASGLAVPGGLAGPDRRLQVIADGGELPMPSRVGAGFCLQLLQHSLDGLVALQVPKPRHDGLRIPEPF